MTPGAPAARGHVQWRGEHGERGSAPVEFALVAPLVLVLALAVVQLALALHVRATLTAAAAEGARAAAMSGADASRGEARVRALLASSGMDGLVDEVRVAPATRRGLAVVEVEVRAALPLIGMLGPTALVVGGTSLREPS